jgi:hypothetical protein
LLVRYLVIDEKVVALKKERDDERHKLEQIDTVTAEMQRALRKLDIAKRTGSSAVDVTEEQIVVPEAQLARVVGPGGRNIGVVEAECSVLVNLERPPRVRAAQAPGSVPYLSPCLASSPSLAPL